MFISVFQDSQLEIDQSQKEPFLELHRILEALKKRDLQPALEWVDMYNYIHGILWL